MDKISAIKERIFQFIEKKGITKAEFCENTGISYANFKGKSLLSELSGDKIAEIISIYEEISPDWLLTGTGHMLRDDGVKQASVPVDSPVIDSGSMSLFLKRFEELVVENALLKKELEDLKKQLRRE